MTTSTARVSPLHALLAWLDESEMRYEVLDGAVVVSPPDRVAHARRVLRLAAALLEAAPEGLEVLGPNSAVYYDPDHPDSFVLPDVFVARAQDLVEHGVREAPLLVVEVLSPSTRRRDHGEKQQIYAELGVPHYWLVDPMSHAAIVLRLDGGRYRQVRTALGELQADEPFAVRVPL